MQEAQKAGWKDKLIELNNKTMVTKDKLIHLEVILMDELDVRNSKEIYLFFDTGI